VPQTWNYAEVRSVVPKRAVCAAQALSGDDSRGMCLPKTVPETEARYPSVCERPAAPSLYNGILARLSHLTHAFQSVLDTPFLNSPARCRIFALVESPQQSSRTPANPANSPQATGSAFYLLTSIARLLRCAVHPTTTAARCTTATSVVRRHTSRHVCAITAEALGNKRRSDKCLGW
jgi:hypothetical protein